MSATAKPKRRFWQFHLSTAVLLMVAASGMFAYNLTCPTNVILQDGNRYPLRGWPRGGTITPRGYVVLLGAPNKDREIPAVDSKFLNWEIVSTWFLYDAFFNLSLLILLAIGLEYFIRRREGRKL